MPGGFVPVNPAPALLLCAWASAARGRRRKSRGGKSMERMRRDYTEQRDLATLGGSQRSARGSALARARYERRLPFRLRLGPVTITLLCLALVGALALVYLGQQAAVASEN